MSGERNGTDSSGQVEGGLRVLIDAWPLVHQPDSAAAVHIVDLVGALPAWAEVILAVPARGPESLSAELLACLPALREVPGKDPIVRFEVAAGTPGGRLRWEQRSLPEMALAMGVHLLHCTGENAPLFAPVPVLLSPVPGPARPVGFANHLRAAMGAGGISRAHGVIWPGDLPANAFSAPLVQTAPFIHPAFFQQHPRPADVPEQYVLAPGPLDAGQVELLAAAWGWISGGLGADWSLLTCGLPAASLNRLRELCQEYGSTTLVEEAGHLDPRARAALFQHAGAVLYAGDPLPWGDPTLYALACARPLAAQETERCSARAGSAAFLTSAGDARALGAAIISILVEEPLANQLSQAGAARAAAWKQPALGRPLAQVYADLRARTG